MEGETDMPQYRLKDRNKPLPGGTAVYDAGTGYRAPQFASFTVQWQGLQAARRGNPGLCARYRLSTDDAACMEYVDTYLGKMAHDAGLSDYYITTQGDGAQAAAVPFHQRHGGVASRVAGVAAGVKTIYEWINSKQEAVPSAQANLRANVCAECPLNGKENILDFFEIKSTQAIMVELQRRKGWNLSTPFDDRLGVCHACFCVNELSVHCPIEIKLKHIPKEAFDALHKSCWVRSESAALPK